jgi:hypothetical protein
VRLTIPQPPLRPYRHITRRIQISNRILRRRRVHQMRIIQRLIEEIRPFPQILTFRNNRLRFLILRILINQHTFQPILLLLYRISAL